MNPVRESGSPDSYAAIVLAGGTGERLGGADKAAVMLAGRPLLDHVLDALAGEQPRSSPRHVVVVGSPRACDSVLPISFTMEDPPRGGPVAGVYAGLSALGALGAPGAPGALGAREPLGSPGQHVAATSPYPIWVVVAAVDMPHLSADTISRLFAAARGHEGAFLVDGSGRRQLAGVLSVEAVRRRRPPVVTGLAVHRWLSSFDLAEVNAHGDEARDVDHWSDLEA